MSVFDAVLTGALLRLPPETAHHTALFGLSSLASFPGGLALLRALYPAVDSPVTVAGLTFPNRVGLAAGYDKNACAVAGLDALGFGHLELGTVTPLAQDGNPGVRIVRSREHGALVNRMGFPSAGIDMFAKNLAQHRSGRRAVIGVNLGKNRATPNERAVDDYLVGVERLGGLADYLAVNVSSPNTKGLRELGEPVALEKLVRALVDRRDDVHAGVPIFVKLSPDDPTLGDAARAVEAAGGDGLIVSNTTTRRPVDVAGEGGLSGGPLGPLALAALEAIVSVGLPKIAVGGLSTKQDVQRRLDAGADLVQVFTAFVFHGPGVVAELAAARR